MIVLEFYDKKRQSGDLYLFTNRQRNKIKCLYWDTNGFVLYYKRLERGRFRYSDRIADNELVITKKQLRALFIGLDFRLLRKKNYLAVLQSNLKSRIQRIRLMPNYLTSLNCVQRIPNLMFLLYTKKRQKE